MKTKRRTRNNTVGADRRRIHSDLSNAVEKCNCTLCQRINRINAICKKLPKADAEWLIKFHDAVLDAESEESMRKAWESDPTNPNQSER